ncbi:hypothetical protein [Dactylosporangium sp. NPDC048998]|uniref:hypothetical protein n=1 Tax=Dactylosporangium sp. NPDC048998 TaxID=3363976 RepID=UPI003718B649
MNPTVRRVAASVTAWGAGAAASIAVSLVALSSIDAGSAVGPAQQLAPDGLTRVDTEAGPSAPPPAPPSDAPEPPAPTKTAAAPVVPGSSPSGVQRLLTSPGGTVVARCTGSSVYLVSWSPAQGYQVTHVERGPGRTAEVAFRGARRVEIEVRCVGGRPTAGN